MPRVGDSPEFPEIDPGDRATIPLGRDGYEIWEPDRSDSRTENPSGPVE